MKYNFKNDLKFGQEWEKKAFEALKKFKKNDDLTCTFNDDHRYDFITNENKKYEVKTDRASWVTCNFYIEFWCNFKPSGLSTTEADYYIITNTIDFYLVAVDDLVSYINNTGPPTVGFKSDVGLVKGYIIKIKDFIKIKNVLNIKDVIKI